MNNNQPPIFPIDFPDSDLSVPHSHDFGTIFVNRVQLLIVNMTNAQYIMGELPSGSGVISCGNGNGYIGPYQVLQFNFHKAAAGNINFSLAYEAVPGGYFTLSVSGTPGDTPPDQYVTVVTENGVNVNVYYLGTRNGVKMFNAVLESS